MGHQIVKQPNGLYAVWSTVVDDFVLENATEADIVEIEMETETKHVKEWVHKAIDDLERGIVRGRQRTYDECIRLIELHSTGNE